jgi:hypothetical protein
LGLITAWPVKRSVPLSKVNLLGYCLPQLI